MDDLSAARLLRRARTRAGLTQRELSARAGTSQSVVARIETGATDPGTATLVRLLGAAGFTARCVLLREVGAGRTAGAGRPPRAGRSDRP